MPRAQQARPARVLMILAVALLAIGGGPAALRAAPQTFNTALPVGTGEFIFREQFVLDQSGDDPSAASRNRTAWAAVSVLGYGIDQDLAVFGVLPYVDKTLELTVAGKRRTRGAAGLGDASLFGRYTVFKKDWPGRTFRVAPFAGLEMPTGDSNVSDGFGRLPPGVQPGSGSWDPFGGVVATYQTLDFQIDAQAGYKLNTEAHGFEFGDVARFDASLQVRLWPAELGGGLPDFLYGTLDANLIHQGKNEIGGATDPNSGGMTLFLAPGLQYVTKRFIIEAIVQVPVFQDLNGTALEKGFIVRTGFRFNF